MISVSNDFHISEDEFWHLVDFIGWQKNYVEKKDKHKALIKIRERLLKNFDSRYIELANEYHKKKYRALMSYYDSLGGFEDLCGDDSWWDFTAHIVGLGRSTFIDAFKHPAKYKKMLTDNQYEECFSYCFNDQLIFNK